MFGRHWLNRVKNNKSSRVRESVFFLYKNPLYVSFSVLCSATMSIRTMNIHVYVVVEA